MICQFPTTTFRNGSLFGQQECSDNVLTRSGCLLASHRPIAPPSDRPLTCALSTPIAPMKAATSSANNSVEYVPSGLSVSPAPRGSSEMQVKCLE